MNFSNGFKTFWWVILTIFLTWIGAWRLGLGFFNNFDTIVFTFWFVLVLLPIISEIKIGGVSIKKDIENAKREIKDQISEIKNEIRNHVDFKPIINVNTSPINTPEYRKKVEDEVNEEEKEIRKKEEEINQESKNIDKEVRSSLGEKARRFEKILLAEKLVSKHLAHRYGENFRSQMKVAIGNLDSHYLVVDGILLEKGKIVEIMEIRMITAKSFDHMFYVLSNFIKKVTKLGIKVPIRFVIVSDQISRESAHQINDQIMKLNWIRKFSESIPKINAEFFKLENSQLIEIDLSKNI